MPVMNESGPDDQLLSQYLLGLLDEEQTDRLDELSIADDDVAWRLRAVEDDLVDAYVGGTLGADTLVRFESVYLSSDRRRRKVAEARAFLRAVDRRAVPAVPAIPSAVAEHRPPPRVGRRGTPTRWAIAAALVIATGAAAIVFQQARLQRPNPEAGAQVAVDVPPRAPEAQPQARVTDTPRVAQERAGDTAARGAAGRSAAASRGSSDAAPVLPLAALVLFPQTRAAGEIPTLQVPAGASKTATVTLDLRLEVNDFPRYDVALQDPATNQILWRSGRVAPRTSGGSASVVVAVPASLLKPQHYALQLAGRRGAGKPETIASYAVEIVTK